MPAARRLRILVVDDEPTVVALVHRSLTEAGYDVLLARSAIEALEVLVTIRPLVDAVLTDVLMPEMDGGKLAATLRHAHPHLPILFMSGFPGRSTVAGPLLVKPFTRDQLLSAVAGLLMAQPPSVT
jgi:two-component system cell cycle sensor histidine kinase/response regulator CckA